MKKKLRFSRIKECHNSIFAVFITCNAGIYPQVFPLCIIDHQISICQYLKYWRIFEKFNTRI
ncbi:unnamed protein product [Brugia timori]|uniref:Uncharacterized protein n=1 Tax=Brugia timori TaxID=42155 RepID=A0A0R3Q3I1_9BILA|nr:unnamed protein product [Brugia timori]